MPADRKQAAQAFLQANGWGEAKCEFLSGDASFRSYQRVHLGDKRAVLMDAPPEKEPLPPFIQMAHYLTGHGYSAPHIIARDLETGFLLLEDLGDDLYSHWLKEKPAQESKLYLEATNFLIDLHKRQEDAPQIPEYDTELLLREATLFVDWYLAAMLGAERAAELRPSYLKLWQDLFERAPWLPNVVVLRDYHADNLLWMPKRAGVGKVGLLDFQDAVMGSPAYDLVSFIEDARRDVAPETAMTAINHYIQQMQWPSDSFMALYSLLGAQRNCKIIGIFTRLAMRDDKHDYLDLLPRVWKHLENDMEHPIIRPLRAWMDEVLPVSNLRGIPPLETKQKSGGQIG
ncbi:MAG: phosphotransferase [Rickettsiales bacterium]|nr:phosphotransferase [Rickettsiales bacterium]